MVSSESAKAETIDPSLPGNIWFDQCKSATELDCIESLGIIKSDGTVVPGKPTGFSHPDTLIASRENKQSGIWGTPQIHPNATWELPGLQTEYGNDFVITEFSMNSGANQWYDPISNVIYPPSGVTSMRFAMLAVPSIVGFVGNHWGVPLTNFNHTCVTQNYASPMDCQRTANFNPEQNIQAILRFSHYRAASLQSNLMENQYKVEELGNGATRVTVSGKPMNHPYFVDSLTLPRDYFSRTAVDAISNIWEVNTTDRTDGFVPSNCQDKGIPIATGNMYSQSVPSWNKDEGTLAVNVWAPHLAPDGSPYLGYYEGNFTTEFISCVWGLKPEEIANQFSISIVNPDDSTESVATLSLSKTTNGIRLVAAGFHYSTEKIVFKRSANKPVVEPSPTPVVSIVNTDKVPTPILINPRITHSVKVKLTGHLVLSVKDPSAWKAKIIGANIVKFESGGVKGTHLANPAFTPLKAGVTLVNLINGKKKYSLRITVTS